MYIPFDFIIIVALLLLGYGFGQVIEKKHYRSIQKREQQYQDILVFSAKTTPQNQSSNSAQLVQGSVVVSVDYFKRFLFALRNIFGGRVEAYESLIDRGRREAVLRMKQKAAEAACNSIFNVKFETSSVSRGVNSAIGSVEVFAYGTAINLNDDEISKPETA